MNASRYDHQEIEKRWQAAWQAADAFRSPELPAGQKRYVLDMFPYPSGDGLHVGHPEGYTATDIVSRYLRMKGYNVLHPMGWDAFGLPAENAAIKKGVHPRMVTEQNVATFKRQIQNLGFSYDWDRELNTTDPAYYKWTQWIFLQLYKRGLAYEAEAPIWWCPKDKTGLANEEVVNGKCDRCGTAVERKMLKQWMLKITAYADRLLADLDKLDWPESIKDQQRNWIGRSEGADIDFAIPVSSSPRLVFVHGKNTQSKDKWYPWLYEQARKVGYQVDAPDMPHSDEPVLSEWLQVLNGLKPDENTVLIGHSRGTATILRWLERLPDQQRVRKVILVASDLGDTKRPSKGFYGKAYDYKKIRQHCDDFVVLHSRDDHVNPFSSGEKNAQGLRAKFYTFEDKRHFGKFITSIPEIIEELSASIRVFTTRPDTIFGATYLVLAPEHELVDAITTKEQKKAVAAYRKKTAAKSDLERTSLEKEKTGVFTGANAINPASKEKIPVWIADYVLKSYGTGAIMAVPAHDERDFAFANIFKLPIVKVIKPPSVMPQLIPASAGVLGLQRDDVMSDCWTGEGTMVRSGKFDGTNSNESRNKITTWLQHEGKAKPAVNYKLRDWVFSRQRYWGEPIPLVHCAKDGVVPVPEKELPVLLPDVKKYEPTGTGESPLAIVKDWVNTTCPKCGGPAKRETNTMPQWAGSCWYYLRYIDPNNEKVLADPKLLKAWLPVDLYVGGAEHAVLHLLYARFWHKVLFDAGVIPKECGDEPFTKLKNQGLILGEDGEKMSKSRGNVINPDDIVKKSGADSLRMFEMFMGPFEDVKPWKTDGVVGVRRFLDKVWIASDRVSKDIKMNDGQRIYSSTFAQAISGGIEDFRFNTCVSDFMKWANNWGETIPLEEFELFLKLLSPFAPHIAEELWVKTGHTTSITQETWPKVKALHSPTVKIVVQVNGKLRASITVKRGSSQTEVQEAAMFDVNVQKFVTGKPKKVIFVPDRLINFVV